MDVAGLAGLAVAAGAAWSWPAGVAVASVEALAVSWRLSAPASKSGEEVG
jgi:hypothetical protein